MEQPAPLSAVFIGQGTLLVRCAEVFLAAGHRVSAVVSTAPRIQEWATARSIPHLAPIADLAGALTRVLTGGAFDYLFSVANMRLVGADVLALPRRGAVNFHDALLPKYAGAHATSWAILNGETVLGVTWHEMTAIVDAGRLLKQRRVDVGPDETAVSLNAKCYEAGIESFAELVRDLTAGTPVLDDPRLAERTYFPLYKRPTAAGVMSWERPAVELSALARALDFGPSPNPLGLPKIDLGGAVLLAPRVEVLVARSQEAPGTVVAMDDAGLVVATGTNDVRLSPIMTIDGLALAPADLAGRYGVRVGMRLPRLAGRVAPRPTLASCGSLAASPAAGSGE